MVPSPNGMILRSSFITNPIRKWPLRRRARLVTPGCARSSRAPARNELRKIRRRVGGDDAAPFDIARSNVSRIEDVLAFFRAMQTGCADDVRGISEDVQNDGIAASRDACQIQIKRVDVRDTVKRKLNRDVMLPRPRHANRLVRQLTAP